MNRIKRALRKAIGRPITNREFELSKGLDYSMSYARFESMAMQFAIASLPKSEQFGAMMRYSSEWGAWLDAPYEPGKVFSPSYATKEQSR